MDDGDEGNLDMQEEDIGGGDDGGGRVAMDNGRSRLVYNAILGIFATLVVTVIGILLNTMRADIDAMRAGIMERGERLSRLEAKMEEVERRSGKIEDGIDRLLRIHEERRKQ